MTTVAMLRGEARTMNPFSTDVGWHLAPPDSASGIGGGDEEAGPADGFVGPEVPFARSMSFRTYLNIGMRLSQTMFDDAPAAAGAFAYPPFGGRTGPTVMVYSPAYVKSLLVVDPALAPSATRVSPLRPILGPDSVLTAIGDRHKRQRALLMPQFHGRSIANYREGIETATARHIDSWPVGKPVAVADIGQQITLDVIMQAIFGVAHESEATPAENRLRRSVIRLLRVSTTTMARVVQMVNARREDPNLAQRLVLGPMDRAIFEVIAERRAGSRSGDDILSVLLTATAEDGESLSDSEIRDELVTLLLAGHETTSNTTAWAFERLTRHPAVYDAARDAAASGDDDYLEALLNETMRSRPVVPVFGREVLVPWRLGPHVAREGSIVLASALLLHHRDDLYPRPFAFDPERFVGVKPPPNTLMPFGGGNRRCLGSTLAMAELRIVMGEILRRVDLQTHDRPGERPVNRNVTMIPGDGGTVVATRVH
jgi:cytochrome P450